MKQMEPEHKLKTRAEMALELGVSTRTLSRRIKQANINIMPGLLTIKDQQIIYALFRGEEIDSAYRTKSVG